MTQWPGGLLLRPLRSAKFGAAYPHPGSLLVPVVWGASLEMRVVRTLEHFMLRSSTRQWRFGAVAVGARRKPYRV